MKVTIFVIRLALHTTSSAENCSPVLAEKWSLYCELFAIGMFWPYKMIILYPWTVII